jgi:hypothetical protein
MRERLWRGPDVYHPSGGSGGVVVVVLVGTAKPPPEPKPYNAEVKEGVVKLDTLPVKVDGAVPARPS